MFDISAFGSHWTWMIIGLILLALELTVSGFFFLWIGIAALATAILTAIFPITWSQQLVFFAISALLSTITWWLKMRSEKNTPDEASNLNNRGANLIGREAILEEPIRAGRGRIRIDDTTWICEGLDCPKGIQIKVIGFNGNILKVEAVKSPL